MPAFESSVSHLKEMSIALMTSEKLLNLLNGLGTLGFKRESCHLIENGGNLYTFKESPGLPGMDSYPGIEGCPGHRTVPLKLGRSRQIRKSGSFYL